MSKEKYDATYKFGNTIVNIVAPKNQTKEEIEQILKDYHIAGRAIVKEMQEKKLAEQIKQKEQEKNDENQNCDNRGTE